VLCCVQNVSLDVCTAFGLYSVLQGPGDAACLLACEVLLLAFCLLTASLLAAVLAYSSASQPCGMMPGLFSTTASLDVSSSIDVSALHHVLLCTLKRASTRWTVTVFWRVRQLSWQVSSECSRRGPPLSCVCPYDEE
jgi:hypothetical protein